MIGIAAILYPFKHVTRRIEQAEGIWRESADGLTTVRAARVVLGCATLARFAISTVGHLSANLITPPEGRSRAAPVQVLPFCLRW